MTGRPVTTMPRVASTDSRNPKLVDSAGCASTSTITARHRKLKPRPGLPPARATSPMAPITAARRTLASGPTIRTNSPSPARPSDRREYPAEPQAARGQQQGTEDEAAIGAADRCQVGHPDGFHGHVQLGIQVAGVSGDHPGRRPRASPPNCPAAAVNWLRSSAGPCCQGPGVPSVSGAELAERTAASAWPGAAGLSLPVVRSRWPGRGMFPAGTAHDQQPGGLPHAVASEVHFDQGRRHCPPVRESRTPRRPEPAGRTRYLHFRDDGCVRSGGSCHGTFVPPGGVDGGVAARCSGEEQGHGHCCEEASPCPAAARTEPRHAALTPDDARSRRRPEPARRVRQRAASAAGCRWCPAAAVAHTSAAEGTRRTSVRRSHPSRAGAARYRGRQRSAEGQWRKPVRGAAARQPCCGRHSDVRTVATARSQASGGRRPQRTAASGMPLHVRPVPRPGPGASAPRAAWVRHLSTASSSSTRWKRPCWARHSTIRCASTGPTRGRVASSSMPAVFRLIFPAAGAVPSPSAGLPGAPGPRPGQIRQARFPLAGAPGPSVRPRARPRG